MVYIDIVSALYVLSKTRHRKKTMTSFIKYNCTEKLQLEVLKPVYKIWGKVSNLVSDTVLL